MAKSVAKAHNGIARIGKIYEDGLEKMTDFNALTRNYFKKDKIHSDNIAPALLIPEAKGRAKPNTRGII